MKFALQMGLHPFRACVRALFPFGLAHELFKTCHIGDSEVTAFTTQQADRPESAQLPRDRFAMRADAVCNVREGGGWGQQCLPLLLAGVGSQTKQLGVYSVLDDEGAELENAF